MNWGQMTRIQGEGREAGQTQASGSFHSSHVAGTCTLPAPQLKRPRECRGCAFLTLSHQEPTPPQLCPDEKSELQLPGL